jgi:hypothetical protein
MEKQGFIYIWYDRKRKMYYLGSHWGVLDDGYICSSNRMRDAYRRRPHDFRRKIIKRNIDRQNLLEEEYKWLSLISESELGKKYYNLRKHKWGHWSTDTVLNLSVQEKIKATLSKPEVREKISAANRGRVKSEETIQKIKVARSKQIYTEETKKKISESHKGERNHFFGKKHSEETKKKMSEAARKRTDNRKHSEETKQKMREIVKNRSKEHPSLQNLLKGKNKKKELSLA